MKNSNRGFSLVELMIALAASAIIILGANYLLSTSHNNYRYEKNRIDLQQEAQIASIQITNKLLEATSVESSLTGFGTLQLDIYGRVSGSAVDVTRVSLGNDKKLYVDSFTSGPGITPVPDAKVMADYVEDFKYTPIAGNGQARASGKVELDLKDGNGTYHAENVVTLRNSQQ